MPAIARRAKIPASATMGMISRVNELKGRGVDVISLGAGEPGYATPPHIREFAKKALDDGYTHYSTSAGVMELREAVAEKLSTENRVDADPRSEILITVGGKEGVFLAMQALIDPGEKVIVTDPCWLTYEPCIRIAEGVPHLVPLDESNEFRLPLDEIERAVDRKTRMLVINSPHNPTGSVLTYGDLEGIAEIAKRNDLYVLSDELYEYMLYDGMRHVSIASLPNMSERTITINGFSKAYAMTGWRLGYMVAPKGVMPHIMAIHEHSVTGPCTFGQIAAAEGMRDKRSREFIGMMVSEYQKRRDVLIHELGKIDVMSCVKPRGAFYAFVNTSSVPKGSAALATYFLEKAHVATIPGVVFGPHGENHLRMTFTNPEHEIREATRRMGEALKEYGSASDLLHKVRGPNS